MHALWFEKSFTELKKLVISRGGSGQEFYRKFTTFEMKSSSVSIKYLRFQVYTSSIQLEIISILTQRPSLGPHIYESLYCLYIND